MTHFKINIVLTMAKQSALPGKMPGNLNNIPLESLCIQ